MAGKRRVLIITPGLTYLGGTELETLITAKIFFERKIADEIVIFSPVKASNLITEYFNEKRVTYWNYPSFFSLRLVQRIDSKIKQLFKLFGWNFSPLQYTYWWVKTTLNKFRFNYVISDSAQFYYAPCLINLNLDRTLIKFTNCFIHTKWNELQHSILEKCKIIMVTAENQKVFLRNKFKSSNIDVVDVFTWNENRLLEINLSDSGKYTFGMLCRISGQKNIQDGIILIRKLNERGVNANLLIKGPSKDKEYLLYLEKLIIDLDLESKIIIDTKPLEPQQIPTFFEKVKIFLITSNFEGGPNTGLESMAAGVPVLSYRIGAMPERLRPFGDLLLAQNMSDLQEKALHLVKMDKEEYSKLSKELRKHYIENFSNDSILSSKLKYLDAG